MKLLSTTLAAVLFLCASAFAQTTPTRPEGTVIATTTTSTTIYTTSEQRVRKTTVINEIILMRSSTGKINVQINVPTIRLEGEGMDEINTRQIFNMISRTAIQTGYDMGLTPCSTVSTVFAESCIQRTGTGANTRFLVMDPVLFGTRDFSVTCNGTSTPEIAMTKLVDPGCTSGGSIQ